MKLEYRAEIDGLRAIAVLSVIFYHAEISISGFNMFSGGFIGVDIFFVISGYLISSIIFKELNQKGEFSFQNFYERRIRRIIPALLLVIFATIPLAWQYLYPTDFVDFSKSILFALGFGSNFYFHFSGLEYGAADAIFKPLLHTWTLSVEEQFYLIFPALIFISFKHFKNYLVHIIIIGFILSLLAAHWGTKNHASETFYFLHSRMWELLAGSFLAFIENKKIYRPTGTIYNSIFPLVGFLLIAHAIIFFKDTMPHPSFYTLSPVAGACLLIWFSGGSDLVTKVLASKLFVGLGLLSYSLYLWHYPVLSFGKIVQDVPVYLNQAVQLVLVLLMSVATYFLVEKTCRNRSVVTYKYLLAVIIIAIIILVSFSSYVISNNGIKSRFSELAMLYDQNEFDSKVLARTSWKYVWLTEPEFTDLEKINVLIVGDSHSKDMFNVFYQNNELFPDYEFVRMGDKWNDGYLIRRDGFAKLKSYPGYKDADVIMVSSEYFVQELPRLNKLIKFLKKAGKKVVITSKATIFKTANKNTLTQFDILLSKFIDDKNKGSDFDQTLKKAFFNARIKSEYELINQTLKLMAEKEGVAYLAKQDFQCDEDKQECDAITSEGYKIYYDKAHYTLEGAAHFGRKIHEMGLFKVEL